MTFPRGRKTTFAKQQIENGVDKESMVCPEHHKWYEGYDELTDTYFCKDCRMPPETQEVQ